MKHKAIFFKHYFIFHFYELLGFGVPSPGNERILDGAPSWSDNGGY